MADQEFKRHVAFKLRIGDILSGKVNLIEEKFKNLDLGDKQVVRVNVIANITDKFIQDDEKKYATITLDDASGQIRVKTFGEDIEKLKKFEQGDTLQVIGLLRSWNNEVYLIPEIIKKKDPAFLMVRKLELDLDKPKTLDKSELMELKEQILNIVKREDVNGGAEIEALTSELKSSSDAVNQEIKKLLEDGAIYEPRPGRVRYLG